VKQSAAMKAALAGWRENRGAGEEIKLKELQLSSGLSKGSAALASAWLKLQYNGLK